MRSAYLSPMRKVPNPHIECGGDLTCPACQKSLSMAILFRNRGIDQTLGKMAKNRELRFIHTKDTCRFLSINFPINANLICSACADTIHWANLYIINENVVNKVNRLLNQSDMFFICGPCSKSLQKPISKKIRQKKQIKSISCCLNGCFEHIYKNNLCLEHFEQGNKL